MREHAPPGSMAARSVHGGDRQNRLPESDTDPVSDCVRRDAIVAQVFPFSSCQLFQDHQASQYLGQARFQLVPALPGERNQAIQEVSQ